MTVTSSAAADMPIPDCRDSECEPVSAGWFESLPQAPHFLKTPLPALAWTGRGFVGTLAGIVVLAGMATVPVLNILALGFLLEIVGRVARTGKFRSAFYLTPLAARLAGIVILGGLLLLPVRFLTGLARDASLVAPGSGAAWGWSSAAIGVGLLATGHILLVIARGGTWWWFFRPLSNFRWFREQLREGRYWEQADCVLRELGAALRLGHHFRLGLIAFAGVYAWLVLPTLVFGQAPEISGRLQTICLLIGGTALVIVLGWLPFLLTHFAETGRWRAFLELGTVRKRFRRSPFCWTLSAIVLFGLSVPVLLYVALMKNKLPPHDALWDVMIVFFVTVLPAKVLVAWAWHRSGQKTEPWKIWQWFNRLLLAGALGYYVYFLFLARTGGQLGENAIWQYHALLLPFPF